jgi:hypothetical protein
MIPPAPVRTMLGCRLAQIAQLDGVYDSKTDQTDQGDQRFETATEFGTLRGPELTSRDLKPTSGTGKRSDPALQILGISVNTAQDRPTHGAPSP